MTTQPKYGTDDGSSGPAVTLSKKKRSWKLLALVGAGVLVFLYLVTRHLNNLP